MPTTPKSPTHPSHEYDGWSCDPEATVDPPTPQSTLKAESRQGTTETFICLVWIVKVSVKDKNYIWISVRWKAKTNVEESTRLACTPNSGKNLTQPAEVQRARKKNKKSHRRHVSSQIWRVAIFRGISLDVRTVRGQQNEFVQYQTSRFSPKICSSLSSLVPGLLFPSLYESQLLWRSSFFSNFLKASCSPPHDCFWTWSSRRIPSRPLCCTRPHGASFRLILSWNPWPRSMLNNS